MFAPINDIRLDDKSKTLAHDVCCAGTELYADLVYFCKDTPVERWIWRQRSGWRLREDEQH
jgi:hypothetical protein